MNIINYLIAAGLSMAPISELRGSIPYMYLYKGLNIFETFLFCVTFNIMIIPLVYIFLNTMHKLFYKIKFYRDFFDRFVERARIKVKPGVEKYGYWGLMIFVAIPLPITGAYTGTLGAWILGMDKKKTWLFVSLGVIIAGIIVSLVCFFGLSIFDIFLNKNFVKPA